MSTPPLAFLESISVLGGCDGQFSCSLDAKVSTAHVHSRASDEEPAAVDPFIWYYAFHLGHEKNGANHKDKGSESVDKSVQSLALDDEALVQNRVALSRVHGLELRHAGFVGRADRFAVHYGLGLNLTQQQR